MQRPAPEGERLQKFIARAGVTSRRKAEALITEGRVKVNGAVADTLGTRVDPDRDHVEVDGRPIHLPKTSTYIAMWKPTGVVTTLSDELDRRNVIHLIKGLDARVFPVGRLDLDAEGILLLTNDGDLAAALTHPSSEIEKVYRVKVRGRPSDDALDALQRGIVLEDGLARVKKARRVESQSTTNPHARGRGIHHWFELTVTEGRNHLIKRLCEAIGHPVLHLRRMRFATMTLDGLRPGQWRHLRRDELRPLRAMASRAQKKRNPTKKS